MGEGQGVLPGWEVRALHWAHWTPVVRIWTPALGSQAEDSERVTPEWLTPRCPSTLPSGTVWTPGVQFSVGGGSLSPTAVPT